MLTSPYTNLNAAPDAAAASILPLYNNTVFPDCWSGWSSNGGLSNYKSIVDRSYILIHAVRRQPENKIHRRSGGNRFVLAHPSLSMSYSVSNVSRIGSLLEFNRNNSIDSLG